MEEQTRPSMLVLTRQNLPVLANSQSLAEEGVRKGAYVVSPAQGQVPAGLLLASGSEVALAVAAQAKLREEHGVDVSVVSFPAFNRFDEQDAAYKESVLPNAVRNRLSVEMASTFGWQKYVGLDGVTVGIDGFGASGPADQVMAQFGFTVENVVARYLEAFGK